MDKLELFLNENKIKNKNIKYCVSENFKDKNGNILEWEIRPITTYEDDEIRNEATMYDGDKARLDVNKYMASMVARAIVYPDLFDARLQDSYGVKTPEALLKAMVDRPGEYSRLINRVQKLNGFTCLDDDIKMAKN